MTIAVERAESRAAEQRAGWTVREAALTDQCLGLKAQLEEAQVRGLAGGGGDCSTSAHVNTGGAERLGLFILGSLGKGAARSQL